MLNQLRCKGAPFISDPTSMGGMLNPGSLPGLRLVAFWLVNTRVEPLPADCLRQQGQARPGGSSNQEAGEDLSGGWWT